MSTVTIPSSAAVAEVASAVRSCLDDLDDDVAAITAAWSALSGSYVAPEAETAYSALRPVSNAVAGLQSTVKSAASALETYASTLATLEGRLATLDEDIDAAAADEMTTTDDRADLNRRMTNLQAAVDEADAECAKSLNALREYTMWQIDDALSPVNGPVGGAVQGLGAELMNRYRGSITIPGPGAVLPSAITNPVAPYALWQQELRNGELWVKRPGSLWVPAKSVPPLPLLPSTLSPSGWQNHHVWSEGAKIATGADGTVTVTKPLGAPPPWAKWGGKALSVAGGGLTLWGAYTTSYNDTIERHPEWTEEQRQQEAVVDTVAVGGATVAGGAGGAWAGAAAGAAIGSIFPGPGTLIGGIIGGIIGGVGGGALAGGFAQDITDEVRGDEDLDAVILAPGAPGVDHLSESPPVA